MAAKAKQAQQLARKLLKASLENGAVSPERVAGVLEYVATRATSPIEVLKAYRVTVSSPRRHSAGWGAALGGEEAQPPVLDRG